MASSKRTDDYFRKRFKIERERRGWSQADVANMLGDKRVHVPVTAIAKIEAGTRTVRIDEAVAIADLFGVSLDSLLGRGAGLEDDLAYSLRALRETAQRIYSQLRPLTLEFAEARDEALRCTFAGRDDLADFCNVTLDKLTAAATFLSVVETRAGEDFAAPEGSTVGRAGDPAATDVDTAAIRSVFDMLAMQRRDKGMLP